MIGMFDVNNESPDLQNEILNIGIEVTRDITPKSANINKYFNKYIQKNVTKKDLKSKIDLLGGDIFEIENMVCVSPTKGLYNTKLDLDLILKSVNFKLKKLQNYKIFNKNYLYIFSETCLFNNDMEYVLKGIQENEVNFDKKYDLYFINCTDNILC